ncbi:MAG: hypothetical protein HY843_03450 [Bdellovibrio sp.]|nr:hypothetical protein [Bdellovibrio sp.]
MAAFNGGQLISNNNILYYKDLEYSNLEELLYMFTKSFADLLAIKYKDQVKLPRGFRAQVSDILSGLRENGSETLIVKWRNKIFLENIIILVQRAKKQNKPAVVIVGNAHVAGIRKLLSDTMGSSITIRTIQQEETD